jgi:branched-chain amino acid transport system permease protein
VSAVWRANWVARAAVGSVVLSLFVVGIYLVTATVGTPSFTILMTGLAVNIVLVVGIQIFSGPSGIVSFGHVGFMAIGAFVAAPLTMTPAIKETLFSAAPSFVLESELSLVPAMVIAAVVAGLFAALVGPSLMRLSFDTIGMGTFAVLIITYVVFSNADFFGGGSSIYGVPETVSFEVAIGFAIFAVFVARFFRESPWGMRLQAVRDDDVAASSNGVGIVRARMVAWILSAMVVAIGGALFAHYLTVFSARSFFYVQTFALMAMLILGGMGSVTGALAGATGVTLISEVFRQIENGNAWIIDVPTVTGLSSIVVGVLILVAMKYRPAGLAGMRELDEQLVGRLVRRGVLAPATAVQPLPAPVAAPSREPATAVPPVAPAPDSEAVLEATELHKSFAGVKAVDGVSIRVGTGEIVGLIGPNGSGKTTLINLISGLLKPDSGDVLIDGESIRRLRPSGRFRRGVSRTFQNIKLFSGLNVIENVEVSALTDGRSLTIRTRSQRLLEAFGLGENPGTPSEALSYGDQRRLEITRTLAGPTRFLLLDEPAAGMNDAETALLAELLEDIRRERGCGILLVDHDLDLILRFSHRIVVMNEGRVIFEGTADEVRSSPIVREAYIGDDPKGAAALPDEDGADG